MQENIRSGQHVSNVIRWLVGFFNLKPTKTSDKPEHFRPIALLSIYLKLLERLINNRIITTTNETIPMEQTRFHPQRSYCNQIMALTTHIENGFTQKLKTAVVFIDLTATYDTVWWKALEIIPCQTLYNLLNQLLSNIFWSSPRKKQKSNC